MLNKLFEMACNVPENVGWAIVGALCMFLAFMVIKLGKLIFTAIRERMNDDDDEDDDEDED